MLKAEKKTLLESWFWGMIYNCSPFSDQRAVILHSVFRLNNSVLYIACDGDCKLAMHHAQHKHWLCARIATISRVQVCDSLHHEDGASKFRSISILSQYFYLHILLKLSWLILTNIAIRSPIPYRKWMNYDEEWTRIEWRTDHVDWLLINIARNCNSLSVIVSMTFRSNF